MTSMHDGQMFSTKDRDNDEPTERNCAVYYSGAWCFKDCHNSNRNGQYHFDPLIMMAIDLFGWTGAGVSIY